MASPDKVTPPQTLPANFFDKQNVPETLPPDFFDKEQPVSNPFRGDAVHSAPTGIVPWFQNAEEDLMHGGDRTVVGRALGHLQGRGDKGYSGLESGVSPGAAEYLGSPELGVAQAGKGLAEAVTGHPLTGLKDIGLGAWKGATIPLSFVAPEAADAAIEAIPTQAKAAEIFSNIAAEAERNKLTVPMQETTPALRDWRTVLDAGGKPGGQKGVMQLEKTVLRSPRNIVENEIKALPYDDARLRYSHITEQAHEPFLQKAMGRGMSPKVARSAQGVRAGLNSDIRGALRTIGQDEDYDKAMSVFKNAKRLQRAGKIAAGLAAGEAARRTGLLGNWIHRTALQQ